MGRTIRMILAACVLASGALVLAPPAMAADTLTCGTNIKSAIRTDVNSSFRTFSPTFVDVPRAIVSVTVPAGKVYCAKVRFSANAVCEGICFVRAITTGGPVLDPPAQIKFKTAQANSFEWVRALSAGTHNIRIQARFEGFGRNNFDLPDWTLVVDVAKDARF